MGYAKESALPPEADIDTRRSAFWPTAEVRGDTAEQPLLAGSGKCTGMRSLEFFKHGCSGNRPTTSEVASRSFIAGRSLRSTRCCRTGRGRRQAGRREAGRSAP